MSTTGDSLRIIGCINTEVNQHVYNICNNNGNWGSSNWGSAYKIVKNMVFVPVAFSGTIGFNGTYAIKLLTRDEVR